MTYFNFIIFILLFSIGPMATMSAQAQNYVDIELNPTDTVKKQKVKNDKAQNVKVKNKNTGSSTPKKANKPTTPPPALPAPKTAAPLKLNPPATSPKPEQPNNELVDIPKTPEAPDTKSRTQTLDLDDQPRFKNRHAFAVDYSTWYETMKLKSKLTNALTEANSHYFGVAFNYDFTSYREKYGFALTVGGITGNAQAGTKDSGDYYERRIVWTGFRAGGRLFLRANNRVDLGLGFLAQSKATKWPEEDVYSVAPQANPQFFYYLDTRWRLNYRYEIIQALGTHLRSYALAWMLGINYTLN